MSTSITLRKSEKARESLLAKPLDEGVWQAWLLKGRTREAQSHSVRIKAVKWISLAALLVAMAAGLWPSLAQYDIAVRFIVAAGAVALMSQAVHAKEYAFAALFGALAMLYNPVATVFSFSGDWQRALVVASTVPFVASLTWRHAKLVPSA